MNNELIGYPVCVCLWTRRTFIAMQHYVHYYQCFLLQFLSIVRMRCKHQAIAFTTHRNIIASFGHCKIQLSHLKIHVWFTINGSLPIFHCVCPQLVFFSHFQMIETSKKKGNIARKFWIVAERQITPNKRRIKRR